MIGLTACEPVPRGPVQAIAPEAPHFETQFVRREVDRYKDEPSPTTRRKMEQAFTALDAKLAEMETRAAALAGEEKASLEREITNLKQRRALHWTRAQEATAQLERVEKAQPVGEKSAKVVKARPANQAAANTNRPRARRVYRQTAPQQENLFQRLGRLFQR